MAHNVMALDENHDVYVDPETGQLARLTDSDAVLQTVKTRLLLVQQEWFVNLDAGLPWFTELMGNNPNLFKIRTYIAKQIIGTDGVDKLKTLQLNFNKAERKLDIEFEYVDVYGTTISGGL